MVKCSFNECKKRLSLVDESIRCRCDHSFCAKHRDSARHNCTFNYKDMNREILTKKIDIDLTSEKKVVRI